MPRRSPPAAASSRRRTGARGRIARAGLLAALAVVGASPAPLAAQAFAADTLTTRAVASGVVLRRVVRPAGPWVIHVLAADLRAPGVAVESAHAFGALAGRERTTDVAARWCAPGRRVVAAVNGDLFDLATGESEGNQVVAGVVLKAGATTDSPHDSFDNAHSQLAATPDGRARIGRWAFAGELTGGAVRVQLTGVNAPRSPGAVLFTAAAGARTPRDSSRADVVEAAFGVRGVARAWPGPHAGDTLRLRRFGPVRRGGGTPIPERGVVIVAPVHTPAAALLASSRPRDLAAVIDFAPTPGPLRALIGGWGRLVADGQVVAARADSVEGTFPRFSARRHPRTAVGLTRGGDTLLLVTVDGRSARSVGMTFEELGTALRALGAWDALNLDGGGSTTMVVDDSLVTTPSDSAGERTVGNMLLVTAPRPGRRCPTAAPRGRPATAPRYDGRDPDARPATKPGT